MALFVHLTSEQQAKRIQRNGIFCQRGQYNGRKIRERYEARMRTPADGNQP